MFIARVPTRNSPQAILLREIYRENGKVKTRTLDDGSEVHSFQTLLHHLGTIVRNRCTIPGADKDAPLMEITTTPSAMQKRAYELLDTITVYAALHKAYSLCY